MADRQRVDRVELSPFDRGKAVDVYCREFVCSAAGKVQGSLDAETADVRGACKVGGDVTVMILKVGGSMKVAGNVKAELIRAKGALKIAGDVVADHFRIAGATKVLGGIESSGEIFVQGVLSCAGSIRARFFTLHGAVRVDEVLRAGEFNAQLGGMSAVRQLEADRIRVISGSNGGGSELVAKRITGKEVFLEDTVAELVEGEKVTVGKGCTVKEVKAAQLEVHRDSKVGKRL